MQETSPLPDEDAGLADRHRPDSDRRLLRHEDLDKSLLLLAVQTDRDAALALIAETAARLVDAETLVMPTLTPDRLRVRYDLAVGRHRDVFLGTETPVENAGLCGWVIENGAPILTNRLLDDHRVKKELAKALGVHSALLVPLMGGGVIVGGLSAFNKVDGSPFTEDDRRDLELLAGHASVVLDNIGLVSALHAEKARLEAVLGGVNDGILFISPSGIVISANKAAGRYLPISPADLVGMDVRAFNIFKPLADVFGWKEKARPGSRCWELTGCGQTDCPSYSSDALRCWYTSEGYCAAAGGAAAATGSKLTASCASCVVYKDAVERLAEPRVVGIMGRSLKVSSSVVLGGNGEGISGEVMVFHDVTAEKQTERQMERFIEMITNDLKVPLTSIMGYCEMMAEEVDLARLREMNASVARNASRLARMMGEYLDALKSADVRERINPVRVSLGSFLHATIQPLADKAASEGVTLEMDVAPAAPEVLADMDLLARALSVLVEYSLMHASPRLGISVRAGTGPRGFASIEVFAPCLRLSDDDLTRLFDRYFTCRDDEGGGSGGPGLCMVKTLVDAHGGSVSARRGQKGGAVFSILLPYADGSGQALSGNTAA